MTDIKSMNLAEMSAYFKELGEPAFRARQVFQWLHRGVSSFDEMTNLSKALREKLAAACVLCPPRVERKQVSAQDGLPVTITILLLFCISAILSSSGLNRVRESAGLLILLFSFFSAGLAAAGSSFFCFGFDFTISSGPNPFLTGPF